MAETRLVDFNALPAQVRERLVQCCAGLGSPRPILSNVSSFGGAVTGWVLLAITGLGISAAAWGIDFGRKVQGPAAIALHGLGAALIVLSIFRLIRRIKLNSALPFKPGRYLFPMDFIDARDSTLRFIPMNTLVDFRGVHQHTNGVYTGTTLTFTFEGGIRENFLVHGKPVAEEALRQLGETQRTIRQAVEARDGATIYQLDPMFEVRMNDGWSAKAPTSIEDVSGPAAHPVGGIFAAKGIWALAGATLLLVGAPMWFVRNIASDEASFERAKRSNTTWAYESYLYGGGKRHAEEVRTELLPRAALEEAKDKGTVTALRDFLKEHPDSVVDKDARDEIHALFVKTLEDFHGQAATTDPRLLPFMDRLIGHLESHESTRVETRFHSPSLASLKFVDTLLAGKAAQEFGGGKMIPVAPHFTEKQSIPREKTIVHSLQSGFSAIFPADIMELSQGPRIVEEEPESEIQESFIGGLKGKAGRTGPKAGETKKESKPPPPIKVPTIDIRYKVGWAGDTYSEEKGNRQFVGIVVTFNVSMRIPDEAETFDFDLEVTPPDHFTVDYSSPYGSRFNAADVLGERSDGPSEGRVYDVMAQRAFDQLTSKLRTVFFRPDSKAFRGTEGRSDGGSRSKSPPRRSPSRGGTAL